MIRNHEKMKRKTIAIIASISLFAACSQNKNIYKVDNLTAEINSHQLVAILPAQIELEMNKFLFSEEEKNEIKAECTKEIKDVQGYMYNRLLEYDGEYRVHFQSPQETNRLLKEAGIDLDKLSGNSKPYLNKVLGTDAIVETKIIRRYLMPIGGATTLSVLQGDDKKVNDDAGNIVNTTILYDKNGVELWSIYDEADHNAFVTHKEATRKTLKKTIKKLPYKNY